jgi:hypothetical protein
LAASDAAAISKSPLGALAKFVVQHRVPSELIHCRQHLLKADCRINILGIIAGVSVEGFKASQRCIQSSCSSAELVSNAFASERIDLFSLRQRSVESR